MENAVFAFQLEGTPVECKVFGHGHINFTLRVKTDTGAEYVLQRINQYVFKDPVRLMANVGAVTAYLKERVSDPGRRSIFFLRRMESSTMWMRRGSIGGCMTS